MGQNQVDQLVAGMVCFGSQPVNLASVSSRMRTEMMRYPSSARRLIIKGLLSITYYLTIRCYYIFDIGLIICYGIIS